MTCASPPTVSVCSFGFCFSLVWFCGACMHAWSLSCVRLFATLWALSHQAPLSMGFPRQEYWSGLPFPLPGDLPDQGIELNVSFVCWIGRQILYHWATLEALSFVVRTRKMRSSTGKKKNLSAQYSVVIYRQKAVNRSLELVHLVYLVCYIHWTLTPDFFILSLVLGNHHSVLWVYKVDHSDAPYNWSV